METGTQRVRRGRRHQPAIYSIAEFNAEGSGRTLRAGIDVSYTVVGLRVVISKSRTERDDWWIEMPRKSKLDRLYDDVNGNGTPGLKDANNTP